MGHVRPAGPADVVRVLDNLRPEDVSEVRAATGAEPVASLLGHPNSELMVASNGDLLGLCGVTPSAEPMIGWVWMVGTTALVSHQIEFLRHARRWVAEKHEQFPMLANYVDARNEDHIRWLKWMGFIFIDLVPEWGAERRPFYKFARIQT